jgi:hypothetical protein
MVARATMSQQYINNLSSILQRGPGGHKTPRSGGPPIEGQGPPGGEEPSGGGGPPDRGGQPGDRQ